MLMMMRRKASKNFPLIERATATCIPNERTKITEILYTVVMTGIILRDIYTHIHSLYTVGLCFGDGLHEQQHHTQIASYVRAVFAAWEKNIIK